MANRCRGNRKPTQRETAPQTEDDIGYYMDDEMVPVRYVVLSAEPGVAAAYDEQEDIVFTRYTLEEHGPDYIQMAFHEAHRMEAARPMWVLDGPEGFVAHRLTGDCFDGPPEAMESLLAWLNGPDGWSPSPSS